MNDKYKGYPHARMSSSVDSITVGVETDNILNDYSSLSIEYDGILFEGLGVSIGHCINIAINDIIKYIQTGGC